MVVVVVVVVGGVPLLCNNGPLMGISRMLGCEEESDSCRPRIRQTPLT